MMGLLLIIIGTIFAFALCPLTGTTIPDMMGLLCGAVTNTPMLGGAQSTLLEMHPEAVDQANNMATACAVGYPFGIIGVILSIIVLKVLYQKKTRKPVIGQNTINTFISEFRVLNPAIFGKSIKDIVQPSHKHLVISRVWRDGKVTIPNSSTILHENDHLLVLSSKDDVDSLNTLFGGKENIDWNKEDIDWNQIDNSSLVSKHLLVTKSEMNGVKLKSLKLRNNYGINITRINRAGISLLASPDLRLQLGDRLTVVGHEKDINNAGEILGNEEKVLNNPNLTAIFVGITIGVILGAIPIAIPGMSTPVKLGIAGGPIIVGILMGAFGPRFHLSTYTTRSANLMLRQIGIVVYLACLGFMAGGDFAATVFRPEGLIWIILSLLIAFIPCLLVGIIAAKGFKMDYPHIIGMLCGSMANPMALAYGNTTVEDDEPSEAYATVYPLSMFLRVIIGQIIILLLL